MKAIPIIDNVGNRELKYLKGQHFVYILYKDGVPVYVGITKNIANRIAIHKTMLFNKDLIDSFKLIRFLTRDECYFVENDLIKRLRPKLNRSLN